MDFMGEIEDPKHVSSALTPSRFLDILKNQNNINSVYGSNWFFLYMISEASGFSIRTPRVPTMLALLIPNRLLPRKLANDLKVKAVVDPFLEGLSLKGGSEIHGLCRIRRQAGEASGAV